jgi:Tol biopolymer transport system component
MARRSRHAALLALVAAALAGCGGSEDTAQELAFVSTRDGDYAVYTMAADGGGQRRLTEAEGSDDDASEIFFQIEPTWSPDGTKIAFSSRRSGSFDIYVMNGDGTGTLQLTSSEENDSHPTWSADGNRIAFAREGDVWVMGADGSSPRRVSQATVEEAEPAWSPDGRWIAYVRRTPGTAVREIWLMLPDGNRRRALTKQGAASYTPAWSPDSKRIAFSSNAESERFELYTIGVDGKGLRSVTPTAGDMFEPSWSPDGTKIAYQEGGGIFSVELGGGEVERLTDSENNDSSPVWNPRPPRED